MTDPKEKFLVKYGPDKHREALIQKAKDEGVRPKGIVFGSPALSHEMQNEMLKEFGHSVGYMIMQRNPSPSKEIIDYHIANSEDPHWNLSRVANHVTHDQIKKAIDVVRPSRQDIERYMTSGQFDYDHAVHYLKTQERPGAGATHDLRVAADNTNNLHKFLPAIIDHGSSAHQISTAVHQAHSDEIPDHIIDRLVKSDNQHANEATFDRGSIFANLKDEHINILKTKGYGDNIDFERRMRQFGKI